MRITIQRLIILSVMGLVSMHIAAKDLVVKVTNNGEEQRQELVELDYKTLHERMGIAGDRPVMVKNAIGQEVVSQLTHDGKLLFEAAVRPGSSTVFTVAEGCPTISPKSVRGALYPNRLDDIAWENDKCAYRVYGPALQKRGDKAYGIDVWSKNTPELIVPKRYEIQFSCSELENAYNGLGIKDVGTSIYNTISFHLDHGDGLDAYGVGPSLGCGTPALMDGKQLVLPYCYETYKILDNGPLRFTLELTFGKTVVGKCKEVVEHRIISLDKGSNFNRCEVWYDGLDAKKQLAAGVVIHKEDTKSLVLDKDMVIYADPTDRPDKLGSQVYVGVLFPEGNMDSRMIAEENGDIAGNAVGITDYKPGAHFVYYFGSAWSSYDVHTFNEWKLRAGSKLAALRIPLTVTVE